MRLSEDTVGVDVAELDLPGDGRSTIFRNGEEFVLSTADEDFCACGKSNSCLRASVLT